MLGAMRHAKEFRATAHTSSTRQACAEASILRESGVLAVEIQAERNCRRPRAEACHPLVGLEVRGTHKAHGRRADLRR
jgi:hypothetical protein